MEGGRERTEVHKPSKHLDTEDETWVICKVCASHAKLGPGPTAKRPSVKLFRGARGVRGPPWPDQLVSSPPPS